MSHLLSYDINSIHYQSHVTW